MAGGDGSLTMVRALDVTRFPTGLPEFLIDPTTIVGTDFTIEDDTVSCNETIDKIVLSSHHRTFVIK